MAVDARRAGLILVGCALGLLCGCMQPGKPLVADRSPIERSALPADDDGVRLYTVHAGDTLYSIAWRFDLDYQALARANGMSKPYVVRPDQRLRITSQLPTGARVRVPQPKVAPPPTAPSGGAAAAGSTTPWQWPVAGRALTGFSQRSKGIDFALGDRSSAQARAAASGQVVYAGSGLGGYERLIIIKHSPDLLSAYGFDGRIVIQEGENVKAGGIVADINNRGRNKPSLHFELRDNGDPIDPRRFIR